MLPAESTRIASSASPSGDFRPAWLSESSATHHPHSGLLNLSMLQIDEVAASAIPEGLAWEESAGISAPLLDIVDVLFNLQSHGFFRRQVSSSRPGAASQPYLL